MPVRVDDVVEGGPLHEGDAVDRQGVVVGWQTRLGHVQRSYPLLDAQGKEVLDAQGQRVWHDDDDVVQCICLLRKGDQSLPVLAEVKALVKQLNESPGRLLPGVKIMPYYDRTDLIHVTTDTVRENLLAGMGLVTLVLFMFLTNVRGVLIVAVNIPLALLFAFAVLFLRGKSANLLSIGAVDFGIIVDSSVIIVENIYRHLSCGLNADLPIGRRIILASNEIQRCLFYSTAIMICASCRCSRCPARKGRFSDRWPRPTPSPWAGRCCWRWPFPPCYARFFSRTSSPRATTSWCGPCKRVTCGSCNAAWTIAG